MAEFALAPGWTVTSQPFWLPSVAVLPVLSNRADDPRNVPENRVAVDGNEFVLRNPHRAARLIVNRSGDRLTVIGEVVPETVLAAMCGVALVDVIGGAPVPIAGDVVITDATRPKPDVQARAARLVLALAPPLWRECPFSNDEPESAADDDNVG